MADDFTLKWDAQNQQLFGEDPATGNRVAVPFETVNAESVNTEQIKSISLPYAIVVYNDGSDTVALNRDGEVARGEPAPTITTAIDQAPSGQAAKLIGDFNINQQITVGPYNAVDAYNARILNENLTEDYAVVVEHPDAGTTNALQPKIYGLTIDGNDLGGGGLRLNSVKDGTFVDITVRDQDGHGIESDAADAGNWYNIWFNVVSKSHSGHGFYVRESGTANNNDTRVIGARFRNNDSAMQIDGGNGHTWVSVLAEGNTNGVVLDGDESWHYASRFEGNDIVSNAGTITLYGGRTTSTSTIENGGEIYQYRDTVASAERSSFQKIPTGGNAAAYPGNSPDERLDNALADVTNGVIHLEPNVTYTSDRTGADAISRRIEIRGTIVGRDAPSIDATWEFTNYANIIGANLSVNGILNFDGNPRCGAYFVTGAGTINVYNDDFRAFGNVAKTINLESDANNCIVAMNARTTVNDNSGNSNNEISLNT